MQKHKNMNTFAAISVSSYSLDKLITEIQPIKEALFYYKLKWNSFSKSENKIQFR